MGKMMVGYSTWLLNPFMNNLLEIEQGVLPHVFRTSNQMWACVEEHYLQNYFILKEPCM